MKSIKRVSKLLIVFFVMNCVESLQAMEVAHFDVKTSEQVSSKPSVDSSKNHVAIAQQREVKRAQQATPLTIEKTALQVHTANMAEGNNMGDYVTALKTAYPSAPDEKLINYINEVLAAKSNQNVGLFGFWGKTRLMDPVAVKNYVPKDMYDTGFDLGLQLQAFKKAASPVLLDALDIDVTSNAASSVNQPVPNFNNHTPDSASSVILRTQQVSKFKSQPEFILLQEQISMGAEDRNVLTVSLPVDPAASQSPETSVGVKLTASEQEQAILLALKSQPAAANINTTSSSQASRLARFKALFGNMGKRMSAMFKGSVDQKAVEVAVTDAATQATKESQSPAGMDKKSFSKIVSNLYLSIKKLFVSSQAIVPTELPLAPAENIGGVLTYVHDGSAVPNVLDPAILLSLQPKQTSVPTLVVQKKDTKIIDVLPGKQPRVVPVQVVEVKKIDIADADSIFDNFKDLQPTQAFVELLKDPVQTRTAIDTCAKSLFNVNNKQKIGDIIVMFDNLGKGLDGTDPKDKQLQENIAWLQTVKKDVLDPGHTGNIASWLYTFTVRPDKQWLPLSLDIVPDNLKGTGFFGPATTVSNVIKVLRPKF